MPVEKLSVSEREFCEHLGVDPKRFIGVQHNRLSKTLWILVESDDGPDDRRVPPVDEAHEPKR